MPKSRRRKPKHTGPTRPHDEVPQTRRLVTNTAAAPLKSDAGVDVTPDSVMVGFIHPGEVRGEFAASLFITGKAVPQVTGLAVRQSGPRIAAARNTIAREFLLTPFEWLLGIDADMFWRPHDVEYVLETADRDLRPIVGGLCFADQNEQLFPTIYKKGPKGAYHVALDYPRDKSFPVDATGAAFLLVHRRVLVKMREKYGEPYPWYADGTLDFPDRGEDLVFCERAQDTGFPIYMDTRAKIGHVKHRYLTEVEYDTSREESHFLVTGTGRCGTGYVADLLSRLNIPTGHEVTFNPNTFAATEPGVPPPWTHFRGDASWLAAAFAEKLNVPVAHLVRNPLEVARSMVGMKFFSMKTNHGPYVEWAKQVMGVDWEETEDRDELISRTVHFIQFWTQMIDTRVPNVQWFQVEKLSMDVEYVRDFLEFVTGGQHDRARIKDALEKTEKDVNRRTRDEDLTWDDVPGLREVARRYDYETT